MSKVPELQMLISRANSGYAVTGFDEVDKYGYRNSTLWNNIRRHCEINKIAEIDCLKILARELLRQNEDLIGQLQEKIGDFPRKIIVTTEEFERLKKDCLK